MELIGILIALAIAIWTYNDTQKRGNSGAWAVGVFFLLIVFLPIYLIVRNPLPAQYAYQQPPAPPAYSQPQCMHCGRFMTTGAQFCAFCGRAAQ